MLIVERIIGDTVILEKDDLTHQKENIKKFNYQVKEGDVVIFNNGFYSIDLESTNRRKQQLVILTKNIFKK